MLKTEPMRFFAVPSHFLLLLLLVGFVCLLVGWRRLAATGIGLACAGLWVFGFTSAGEVLFAPLETRFPPRALAEMPAPDGLIVLPSGLIEPHALHWGTLIEFRDGGEGIVTAALLALRFPDARIIVSGGGFLPEPLREADGMARILREFGVAPDRIAIDASPATTADAVDHIITLIGDDRDRTWWLIASAHRMPRAMGTFRAAGFEPVPFPVDFRWAPPFDPTYTYAFLEGMGLTEAAMHEWLGLIVYRLRGRIDTLLPGPSAGAASD